MTNLFIAKSMILFNVFCMQGCAVTVASHPPFDTAMGMSNNTLPVYNARSVHNTSPVPSTAGSSKAPVALQAAGSADTAPAQRKMMHYKMDFSDFIFNNVAQLLMLCAIGGKCK